MNKDKPQVIYTTNEKSKTYSNHDLTIRRKRNQLIFSDGKNVYKMSFFVKSNIFTITKGG